MNSASPTSSSGRGSRLGRIQQRWSGMLLAAQEYGTRWSRTGCPPMLPIWRDCGRWGKAVRGQSHGWRTDPASTQSDRHPPLQEAEGKA